MDIAKQACLERDAHRCRHCGSSIGVDAIQLMDSGRGNLWLLSNLITLCKECEKEKQDTEKLGDVKKLGVILAGGKGSRLYPLTRYQNKHTLSIGLLPMIFYPLKTLRSFGIRRVLVIIDRENSDSIINMLGSGKEFGLDVSYRVQEGAGGISQALYLAKDMVKPDDKIYCILGDNIFDNDKIDKNIDLGSNKACIYLKEILNPQDYGVAKIENGKVINIVEKPKEFVSNMAVLGLYVYTPEVFDIIEQIFPSARNELEISSVNDYYASKNQLQYKITNGNWSDCGGSIQRYCEASLYGAKRANVSSEEIDNFRSTIFDEK